MTGSPSFQISSPRTLACATSRRSVVPIGTRLQDDLAARRRSAAYYHSRLAEVFARFVRPGLRILEIGCAEGDLLASLKPSLGMGVDLSTGDDPSCCPEAPRTPSVPGGWA